MISVYDIGLLQVDDTNIGLLQLLAARLVDNTHTREEQARNSQALKSALGREEVEGLLVRSSLVACWVEALGFVV
jgi:hypothetical protein